MDDIGGTMDVVAEPRTKSDLMNHLLQDSMRSKLKEAMFSMNANSSPGIVGFLPYDSLPMMSNMVAMKASTSEEVTTNVSTGVDVRDTTANMIDVGRNPQFPVASPASDCHQTVAGYGSLSTVTEPSDIDVSTEHTLSEVNVELVGKSTEEWPKRKKPMNAFMIWSREQRAAMAKKGPTNSLAETSIMLGRKWRALDTSEQQIYYDKADILKTRPQVEKKKAVKKPLNAFMLFSCKLRPKLARENPMLSNAVLSSMLGNMWNALEAIEKQEYIFEADKLRLQHEQDHSESLVQPVRKACGTVNYLPTTSSPPTTVTYTAAGQEALSMVSLAGTSDCISRVATHESVANLPIVLSPESDRGNSDVDHPIMNVIADNDQDETVSESGFVMSSVEVVGPRQQSSQGYRRWQRMKKFTQPMNAFNLFWQQQQSRVVGENPTLSTAEVNNKIACMWNELDKSEKQKFFDEALQRKEQRLKADDSRNAMSAEVNGDLDSLFYGEATQLKNYQRKRERKVKKIKRPLNAFMIFSSQQRSLVANENRGMSNGEISSILGNMWRDLSESEKQKFYEEAARQKKQHRIDHPDWEYRPKRHKGGDRRRSYQETPAIPGTQMVIITREDGLQMLCEAVPQNNSQDVAQGTRKTENDAAAKSGPLESTMEVNTEANQQMEYTDFQISESPETVYPQIVQHSIQGSNANPFDPNEEDPETSYQTVVMKEEPLISELEAEVIDETVIISGEPVSSEMDAETVDQSIVIKAEPLSSDSEAEMVDPAIFIKEEPSSSEYEPEIETELEIEEEPEIEGEPSIEDKPEIEDESEIQDEPEIEEDPTLGKQLSSMVDSWILAALQNPETAKPNLDRSSAAQVQAITSDSRKTNVCLPREKQLVEGHIVKNVANMDVTAKNDQGARNNESCESTATESDSSQPDEEQKRTNTAGRKSFDCYICDRSFEFDTQLFAHLRTHAAEKPPDSYQCSHCKTLFISNYYLIKHKQNCRRGPVKCTHCFRVFPNKVGLYVHKKMHAREKCNAILEEAMKKKIGSSTLL